MTDTEIKRRKAICEVAGVKEIDDVSDGFHTFKELYYQRMMLFAVLVKQNKDKAWKSLRHSDGELCFGGGWFIVGIDTLEGSYTYHYEDKYFDLFDCEELERGKVWDGHTEKDVTRLLALEQEPCEDCISRQAVIELAKKGVLISNRNYESVCKAINELPPVNPQPCKDAISRQAALNYISRILNQGTGKKKSFEFIQKYVEKLPPVTPEPKTGHWIDADGDNATCGCCNRLNHLYGTYCKYCGTRMIEK